jgi:hypothetical protein
MIDRHGTKPLGPRRFVMDDGPSLCQDYRPILSKEKRFDLKVGSQVQFKVKSTTTY